MKTRSQKHTKEDSSVAVAHQQHRRGDAALAAGSNHTPTAQQHTIQNSPYLAAQRKKIAQCFGPAVAQPLQKTENKTGMSDTVKEGMETSFNTDFSDVRVHASSSKAPEVAALAYTQGSDIHFAPGQFSQDSSAGKQLLGHELAHVVQQREGRVQPTTEVGGMPVNDDVSLEKEADDHGSKISF